MHGYHNVFDRCWNSIVSKLGDCHIHFEFEGLHIIDELAITLFAGTKVFDAVEQGLE